MRLIAACLMWTTAAGTVLAQAPDGDRTTEAASQSDADRIAEEAIHEQLRALRERMFAAYEKGDIDGLLTDVAPEVVITWQNADRNEGQEEFCQFYDRMMNGDDSIVKDISSTFEVDDLSVLYGDDTAVARGTLSDRFELNDGSNFTLNSKWTATVVNMDGAWKVASFHVSANIFDNPILDVAKGWLVKAGIAGGVIGLIIGLLIGRMRRRRTAMS